MYHSQINTEQGHVGSVPKGELWKQAGKASQREEKQVTFTHQKKFSRHRKSWCENVNITKRKWTNPEYRCEKQVSTSYTKKETQGWKPTTDCLGDIVSVKLYQRQQKFLWNNHFHILSFRHHQKPQSSTPSRKGEIH